MRVVHHWRWRGDSSMIVVAEVRGEKEEEEHKGVAMDVVTKAVEARREGEEEEEETREKKGR